MRDTVKLTESGGTLGFTIQPSIRNELGIKYKDPIVIDIIEKGTDKVLYTYTRPLKKDGSVSIKYYIVEDLKLTADAVLQVDIRKGEKRG